MASVIITGLPQKVKLQKLVYLLKNIILKKDGIRRFWIRELSDIKGTDLKQMTVEFESGRDAFIAHGAIDNFVYVYGDNQYPLLAEIDNDSWKPRSPSPHGYRDDRRAERNHFRDRYDRRYSRSPSPDYRSEASRLDLEIELLRKERQVIEEERRLLLEKKKLELIREFGPSASIELEHLEGSRKRCHSTVREEPSHYKRSRHPTPQRPNKNRKKRKLLDTPMFILPCKILFKEMKPVITKEVPSDEYDTFMKHIRLTLRKRIAVALEGKDYMTTSEIISLYRKLYPISLDEQFVQKILKDIRDSDAPEIEDENKDSKETNEDVDSAGPVEGTDVIDSNNVETKSEVDAERTAEPSLDKETDIRNECALSLDATDIELSLTNMEDAEDWIEGGTDWNDEKVQ